MNKYVMQKIYKITSPSKKCYIGRTKNLDNRMAEHRYNAFTKELSNSLYKAIRKYGWKNMEIEVLKEVKSDKVRQIEEKLIKKHQSVRNGYNDTYSGTGGDNWEGRRNTKDYKNFVERMKEINSSGKMHGKSHTEEARQKQKKKAKGRFTLEWFIERHGEKEGTRLYNERCERLSNRNLKKDSSGKFISG